MSARALIPQELLEDTIHSQLLRCKRFRVAIALVRMSGVDRLLSHLEKALKRGAHGDFIFGIDLPSEPDAIEALLSLANTSEGRLAVRRFASPASRYFHGKFWLFDARRPIAIVGSSNLTAGGMITNYEANVLVDGLAVRDLGTYFEELFEGAYAHNVTSRWLAAYRKLWNERRKHVEEAQALRAKALQTKADPRPRPVPNRIKGNKFVFTGRIVDWRRERKLYPYVRRLGGDIGLKASAVANAAALVQGETMGGRETDKLKAARKAGTLILTESEFLALANRQKRRNH